jgi:hypothetical protein
MTPGPRPHIDRLVEAELGRGLVIARKTLITALTDPQFPAFCRARYRQGQHDYGYRYDWLDWPEAQFRGEILTECADIPIYEAMASVVRSVRDER